MKDTAEVSEFNTVDRLLKFYGSQRLLFYAYWHGLLLACEERVIEENIAPDVRIGMKPLC